MQEPEAHHIKIFHLSG